MKFYCVNCGAAFTTDDIRQVLCIKCSEKDVYVPNKELIADVRCALKENASYGQYKGGKRRH